MKLTYWTAGTIERIYASGCEGAEGRTYFAISKGRLAIFADDFYLPKPAILSATLAWLGLPPSATGQEAFEALKARCTAPRGKPAPTLAAATSPSAPPARTSVPLPIPSAIPSHRLGMSELNFANIRNEKTVEIEIDHREPSEIDRYLSEVENLVVTRKALEVADFRINGRILVERKAANDFKMSVEDGRLFDQAQRIGFTEDAVGVVVIEGDVFRENVAMLFSATTGAITCLSFVQGLSVITTLGTKHTAYLLAKIAQHDRNGLGYELPLRKDKPKQLIDAASYVLQGINGVSAGLAHQLLVHFGSIQAIANASEAELKAVKGVGPKTAASIATTFRATAS